MRIAFCCLMLAGVGVLACGEARPISEADKAAIRAVSDTFEARLKAGDDSGVAELYAENAVFMAPNEGIVEGRAAIRARIGQEPPGLEIELTPVDLDGRGDLAYVRGTYVITMADSAGAPRIVDRGKYVELRRRGGGSEWLIAIDIFNSDQPAVPARARP